MVRLSDKIFYVGVNDTDKVLFEGLWPLPSGVSYNSYVVADEKVALIDTVECGFEEEFLSNVREATDGRAVDYLVVNHMEPDHSAGIDDFLAAFPFVVFVVTDKAFFDTQMVQQFQTYPGIFRCNEISLLQGFPAPLGNISQIANGSGDEV